jgi:hypothetical protein
MLNHIAQLLAPGARSMLESRALRELAARHAAGRYFERRITQPSRHLRPAYRLLQATFDPTQLESEQDLRDALASGGDSSHAMLIGRYPKWPYPLPLPQPLPASPSVAHVDSVQGGGPVAVVSGTYMPLGPGEGCGALGHLATHRLYRRHQGHGSRLLASFEREVTAEAERRGERLRLIVLESLPEALPFWAKQGYRCPDGVRYRQPALAYDAVGQPQDQPGPEFLMLKSWDTDGGAAATIDRDLLLLVVHTLYRHWYLPAPDAYPPGAWQRIRSYLFADLLGDLAASLPPAGRPIALIEPG